MALLVETGDLSEPNAESYVTVAEADTYLAARGNPASWDTLTTSDKEEALRIATQYLETSYRFRGHLIDTTQSLSFPRTEFYNEDCRLLAGAGVIPVSLKNAQIELALRHVIQDLFLDTSPSAQYIKREKVDVHEVEYNGTNRTTTPTFGYVARLLKDYVLSGLSQVRIIRG